MCRKTFFGGALCAARLCDCDPATTWCQSPSWLLWTKGNKASKGGGGAFSFKLFSPVAGIWFNELRSSSRQLTPDCVCSCVCVCACACTRARQLFPPLSQYGCMLVLPGYRSHAMIHTQIYASLFPLKRIQRWRLCSQQPADSIKVQRFAKLQHTGSLCSLCHHFHWKWSELAVLLVPELLAACAGSRVTSDFFFFYFPSCKYAWMFTHVHGHAFLSIHFNGIQTRNCRTRPLRPELAPLNIFSHFSVFSTTVISQKQIMMEADVTVKVFHCVHLSKMLIFRGYFHIVNKMTFVSLISSIFFFLS